MTGKRNTQTESKIKTAFTALVQAKGFDAVTVSDLSRTAGINRGTFYMHYLDKFDLRRQLIDDAIEDLTRILTAERYPPQHVGTVIDVFRSDSIAEALRYVKGEYAFFDAVSRSGSDMQMYDQVKDSLKQLILAQASQLDAMPHDYCGIPVDYALEILVSAVASVIWLWIRRGCEEAPEDICAIIEASKTIAPIDIAR
jgi:AcrR family transcriptional regulator